MKNGILKKLPVLILLLCVGASIPAQNIGRNPRVLWAGVVEQELSADQSCLNEGTLNEMFIEKFVQPENNKAVWEDNFLAIEVLEAVYNKKLEIFSDQECLYPINWEKALKRTDTILTFDPETYEEHIEIIDFNKIDPARIVRWRVQATLYYDNRRVEWILDDIRVAPMVLNFDSDNLLKPIFWFKAGSRKRRVGCQNITWTKTLIPTSPDAFFFPDIANVLINRTDDASPFLTYLKACQYRTDVKFYNTGKYGGDTPMSIAQKDFLFNHQDTMIVIDPETYEETLAIFENDVSAQALRVIETWAWDYRKKRLYIRAVSAAPIHYNLDNMGNLRYYQPLFYTRNK